MPLQSIATAVKVLLKSAQVLKSCQLLATSPHFDCHYDYKCTVNGKHFLNYFGNVPQTFIE